MCTVVMCTQMYTVHRCHHKLSFTSTHFFMVEFFCNTLIRYQTVGLCVSKTTKILVFALQICFLDLIISFGVFRLINKEGKAIA